MKKLILASASAIALLGLAACSDTGSDTTTTQSTQPEVEQTQPANPDAAPLEEEAPAEEPAPVQ